MSSTLTSDTITTDDFTHAFRNHPAGVAVITAESATGPVAMTVSSLSSVAIDPPTLVFSASQRSSATAAILEAETVVVHLLSADQVALAKLGATSGAERFGGDIEWGRLPGGEPYYPAATEWLRGRVRRLVDVNGSTLVVVEAVQAKPRAGDEPAEQLPLVYHNRSWHSIGQHSLLP